MSLSFPELILYLLPGFLGLWVFKRIVPEDIDKRSESTQIAIGLLLGVSGFFALFLLNSICRSEYVSPQALRLLNDGAVMSFGGSISFWISYLMLCVFSLVSGVFWGCLSERGLTLTQMLSRLSNKMLRTTIRTSSESALRILIDSLIQEYGTYKFLARIYPLGEGITQARIGWIMNYSEATKEIVLSRLELFKAVSELNEILDHQPHQSCINYESGVVIEIFDWDKEKMERFDSNIRRKYREAVNASSIG